MILPRLVLQSEPDMWFVALMGIGTVFVGLICIIFLCMIMSRIVRLFEKPAPAQPKVTGAPKPQLPTAIENRGELVAAISAVIAEELGTDITAIRIHSLKRVDQ